VWRLLGVDARLRGARPSFGPPATLIALLGLLTVSPPCAYAVSPDATQESVSSDPGQSAYAAGRFIDALRIWRPRAEEGDARAAFGLGLLYDLGEGVGQRPPTAGTVARPKPDMFSSNSISLCCVIVALARRATRLRPRCGTRARLLTAMRGLNMTWRSSIRRAKACRAISTWRRAGTLLQPVTGCPPRPSSLRRSARRGVSPPHRLLPQTRRWRRQSQQDHLSLRAQAKACRLGCAGTACASRVLCAGPRTRSLSE
jgi:hypothetical protein